MEGDQEIRKDKAKDKRDHSSKESRKDRGDDERKERERHTSRSDIGSDLDVRSVCESPDEPELTPSGMKKSFRIPKKSGSRSPERSKPKSLNEKLLDMATGGSSGKELVKGQWLKSQYDAKKKKKPDGDEESDDEPTEEEIKLQEKLPKLDPGNLNDYRDPACQWVEVSDSGIPSWDKSLLPEELMPPPDPNWRPPTPPKADISLLQYTEVFEDEEPKPPAINEIVDNKERLNVIKDIQKE